MFIKQKPSGCHVVAFFGAPQKHAILSCSTATCPKSKRLKKKKHHEDATRRPQVFLRETDTRFICLLIYLFIHLYINSFIYSIYLYIHIYIYISYMILRSNQTTTPCCFQKKANSGWIIPSPSILLGIPPLSWFRQPRHSRFATSSPKNESSLGPQSSILENRKVGDSSERKFGTSESGEKLNLEESTCSFDKEKPVSGYPPTIFSCLNEGYKFHVRSVFFAISPTWKSHQWRGIVLLWSIVLLHQYEKVRSPVTKGRESPVTQKIAMEVT